MEGGCEPADDESEVIDDIPAVDEGAGVPIALEESAVEEPDDAGCESVGVGVDVGVVGIVVNEVSELVRVNVSVNVSSVENVERGGGGAKVGMMGPTGPPGLREAVAMM